MKPKLQLASIITLLLLSGMLFAVLMSAAYALGVVSWIFMIVITILFNFLAWLFGPFFSDWMYKIFYKIEFYEYEQIKNFPYMKFMKRVCDKHNIPVPKIGIIKDKNPTAFTYGSHTKNARVVLTEGLFDYLNEKEMEAVIAHELGHIVNKDFIIMAIASTILQMLYQSYAIFARHNSGSVNKKGEKKGNYLIFIGYAALFFHWLGTYLLLYLSRTREYYADQFAAEESYPNALTNALLKIAYGIMASSDTKQTSHLLNITRAQGIFDPTRAKELSEREIACGCGGCKCGKG